jgi:hypothetical protein
MNSHLCVKNNYTIDELFFRRNNSIESHLSLLEYVKKKKLNIVCLR